MENGKWKIKKWLLAMNEKQTINCQLSMTPPEGRKEQNHGWSFGWHGVDCEGKMGGLERDWQVVLGTMLSKTKKIGQVVIGR